MEENIIRITTEYGDELNLRSCYDTDSGQQFYDITDKDGVWWGELRNGDLPYYDPEDEDSDSALEEIKSAVMDAIDDGLIYPHNEYVKQPKKCYAVLHICVADGDEHTYQTLGVFADKEDARKKLAEKKSYYTDLAAKGSLWIDTSPDSPAYDDFTDEPDCYEIWKDGYYCTDHVLIKVEETDYQP